MSVWSSEREAAVAGAKQAGQILLDWAGRFSISTKGKNDLVTEADRAAQDHLLDFFKRRFPADDFLGEEDAGKAPVANAKRRWIVDPLDGTTNYVHGFPFFCVSIGLEADGELVVGVIYDPSRKECFSAAKGAGASLNGALLQVSSNASLEDGLVCAGLPADLDRHRKALEAFDRVSLTARSVRRMGSAAISLAYLAAGRLDAYWADYLNPWDSAAGVVLVREAGGIVSNIGSSQYSFADSTLLASNGLLQRQLAELLVKSP